MNEMDKLFLLLANDVTMRGTWSVQHPKRLHYTMQILFYDKNHNQVADAICHEWSYGGREGQIEVMGEPLVHDIDDDVEGHLTGEEVYKRWMEYVRNEE